MNRRHGAGYSAGLGLMVAMTTGVLLFYLYPAIVDNAESTPTHVFLKGTPALHLFGLPV